MRRRVLLLLGVDEMARGFFGFCFSADSALIIDARFISILELDSSYFSGSMEAFAAKEIP